MAKPETTEQRRERGIRAIIFLQSLAGISETRESAARGWDGLSDPEKRETLAAYAHTQKGWTK